MKGWLTSPLSLFRDHSHSVLQTRAMGFFSAATLSVEKAMRLNSPTNVALSLEGFLTGHQEPSESGLGRVPCLGISFPVPALMCVSLF